MKTTMRFLIINIFLFFSLLNHVDLCALSKSDDVYIDDQGFECVVPNWLHADVNNLNPSASELIENYEQIIKYFEFFDPGFDWTRLKEAVEYYNNSISIYQLDSKIAQAFDSIKKDLKVGNAIELRVLPSSIYVSKTNTDAAGFFSPMNPSVVYILDETLKSHPIFIISTIVHELEHYRQYWCFQGSFAWSKENEETLGSEEFDRRLEYGADQKVAEYFKCSITLKFLSLFQKYWFKNPQGYFASWDYLPYRLQNFYSSSKGFSVSGSSDDILDYLPNSGVYWDRDAIQFSVCVAYIVYLAAAVIISEEYEKRSRPYYGYY